MKSRMTFPTSVRETDNCGEASRAKCSTFTVLLSVLMHLALQPTSPWRLVSACRHHGSAISDCLHADGCRDYACHFRFCSTDRWVSFWHSACMYLLNWLLQGGVGNWHCWLQIVSSSTIVCVICSPLSVSGQYFVSTMVIVGMSVIATVTVLQFHHHNPNGGQMPRWVSPKKGLMQ